VDDPRLSLWETLFGHALDILDAAQGSSTRTPSPAYVVPVTLIGIRAMKCAQVKLS